LFRLKAILLSFSKNRFLEIVTFKVRQKIGCIVSSRYSKLVLCKTTYDSFIFNLDQSIIRSIPQSTVNHHKMNNKERVNILWFRNGLRLHDNESLLKATEDKTAKLLPLFIFDGETPTTKHCRFNKISFLLECLEDLDTQLWYHGGKLNFVEGEPVEVFRVISKHFSVGRVCFDQDCEAIWRERDGAVKTFCHSQGIEVVESIGQTLWDPHQIIKANGGTPPLTYDHFCHITETIGPPKRPLTRMNLNEIEFLELENSAVILSSLTVFPRTPTPKMLGIEREGQEDKVYTGGEILALKYLDRRIKWEKESFQNRSFLPNRREPDILNAPKSLSPDLKFGCISVRKFYWAVMDAWGEVNENLPGSYIIVSQLIWREFFYAMSTSNIYYGEMERNPICINVPWYDNQDHLKAYLAGRTGFPFIDAGIRQMKKEGWTHHIVRNALSMFLTRGDLWLSWEHGLKFFLNYMIDGDWSVCAGNWMWVSSSAFEKALNAGFRLDPSKYGRRVDPEGKYIKKYIPELAKMPVEFIYEPWLAPTSVQRTAGCIIGVNYPLPMVNHGEVSQRNLEMMEDLQRTLMRKCDLQPEHIKPSNESEVNVFFQIPEISTIDIK